MNSSEKHQDQSIQIMAKRESELDLLITVVAYGAKTYPFAIKALSISYSLSFFPATLQIQRYFQPFSKSKKHILNLHPFSLTPKTSIPTY